MTEAELRDFAVKVERMCDFLISKGHEAKIDVKDINILHEIKQEAADIATGKKKITSFPESSFSGLAEAVGFH
jgi:hypothetical protein